MKDNPEFKRVSKARKDEGKSNLSGRRHIPAIARRALEQEQPVSTDRGLLICFGWLRLFQEIVSPNIPIAGRKGFRHAR